jgi:hypothetical protein
MSRFPAAGGKRRADVARLATLGLALLLLAGCDPAAFSTSAPSRARVTVSGQPVTIAAPPGFCVDPESTRVDAAGAFVMMGDCVLLGAGGPGGRPVGGILTAAVSSGGLTGEGDAAASLEDILAFVGTPEGRALVGRSGRPDRIRIRHAELGRDTLYLLVEDQGPQPILDRQFWRAFINVKGRMTVLSEIGFADPQKGLDRLAALAAQIKAANGG